MWRIIESGYETPAMNMAVDEAILHSVSNGASPTIRLYMWRPSAVSVGIAQDASIANGKVKVIRRPTGGNAVFHHKDDFTYSVAAPKMLFRNNFSEAYKSVSGCILRAINRVSKRMAAISGARDITIGGRKVCGSAMDFTGKNAFLMHGSVFYNDSSEEISRLFNEKPRAAFLSKYAKSRDEFYNALKASFEEFAGDYCYGRLGAEERKIAGKLAKEKYSNPEWHAAVKRGTICAGDMKCSGLRQED